MKVASIAQTVEEQPHIRRQFKAVSDAVARPFDPAADQLPNLEFGLAVGDARQGEAIGEGRAVLVAARSEEHTSELQSLMRISYAVFCLKKKKHIQSNIHNNNKHRQHNI